MALVDSSSERYAAPVRWMHWIVFACVLAAYASINLFELFPRGSAARANVLAAHYLAGLAVLLLVLPRFWLRSRHLTPTIVPPLDRWADLLGKTTHLALYMFLLVQPILGVVTLQVGGKPVTFFGITLLRAFVAAPNRELSHRLEDIHATIGTIFYWVIGLHILAALWHHCVRRDNTLRRMF
ncbi:MAG: cytochrome b [Rudaea sp.]|nr:cytochrome b [Rudaea sp.]